MVQAVWNGVVIAESNDTIVVEGNHYFPPASINREFFSDSRSHTKCPWKGKASYLNVEVNGAKGRGLRDHRLCGVLARRRGF